VERLDTLRALVDRILPAEGQPSGWQAGVGDFLSRALAGSDAAAAPLVDAGLALLDREAAARHAGTPFAALPPGDQDALIAALAEDRAAGDWGATRPAAFLATVIRLSVQGHYGDPGNGGNRDAVTWRAIGYRPAPPDAAWPPPDDAPGPVTDWAGVADRYDAVVVGAGAGGGVAARTLAEAGLRVLLVERGPWLPTARLRPDHLRNQRMVPGLTDGYDTPAGPPLSGNPRVLATLAGDLVVDPGDPRWSNNAMTVGGGTRVYGAQAWRMCPGDFTMATTYGVPEDSSLADWPIGYDELEPYYDHAEWDLGVSGDPAGNAYAGRRSRGYPMPPVTPNGVAAPLARGARRLGLRTSPVPLLVNSRPYNGRGACVGCGACVGFGCPGEFKTDTRNTVIPLAVATGRCDLLTGAVAERVLTDARGRVTGVALVTERAGRPARREIRAGRVLLGAGAIETARLLLNSASEREPHGLGNRHDQVGRHLQGHAYSGAFGVFDEPVQDCVGPGPSIATNDFRHHNEGIVGGGMLANDFVPTPLQVWDALRSAGVIPAWGAAGVRGMRELYPRLALVMGPIQEIPSPKSRVTVAPGVRDRLGIPVARLSGRPHPEDARTARFLGERAAAWLTAAGAVRVLPRGGVGRDLPSGGQHQAGTCRMGDDPATSVTDPRGRVWGHDNLFVVDGSLHVTNGGVNPVLTILALARYVSEGAAR
jgi:choline dehydrogenase-like flavoprotein